MKTELCELMTKYGSDKGHGPHNYTIYYHQLFEKIKEDTLNIFELGLGTNNIDIPSNMGRLGKPGASLRGWRDYFKNSFIYGADIDNRILFEQERIKTFYCNQKDEKIIKEMWSNNILKSIQFDIIIEDGLHEFDANLIFLKNSLHKLKNNGVYICEDLKLETINSFNEIIKSLEREFSDFSFEILMLEHPNNIHNDNNLLVVKKIR